MTSPPLSELLDLVDVRSALDGARARVDGALRHPALRRHGGRVAAEVGLRSAVASAALEGHVFDLSDVRAGIVTDPVVQGTVRVAGALPGLADTWSRAPLQALARLHVLAAKGSLPDTDLGRPVAGADLSGLGGLVAQGLAAGSSPLLLAAVVHGELLAQRPLPGPNGVVARATSRLTLIASGFDPRGLIAPDLGHLAREPEYVGSLNAMVTGSPDGVRSWLKHYAAAVSAAAAELESVGDSILAAT
jgi:hypothetical protein